MAIDEKILAKCAKAIANIEQGWSRKARDELTAKVCWHAIFRCAELAKQICPNEAECLYKMFNCEISSEDAEKCLGKTTVVKGRRDNRRHFWRDSWADSLSRNAASCVADLEAARNLPPGKFLAFVTPEEEKESRERVLHHTMLSLGSGKAAGSNNGCINGTGQWSTVDLADGSRWPENHGRFLMNPPDPHKRFAEIHYISLETLLAQALEAVEKLSPSRDFLHTATEWANRAAT